MSYHCHIININITDTISINIAIIISIVITRVRVKIKARIRVIATFYVVSEATFPSTVLCTSFPSTFSMEFGTLVPAMGKKDN